MKRSPFPSHAIAYLRVSTKRQGESGVGQEGQLEGIRAFAEHIGCQIVEVYADTASGVGRNTFANRVGLKAAVKHAKAENIPILVYDVDRISRNVEAFQDFLEEEVSLISVSRGRLIPPTASMAALAARAQHQAEAISTSTTTALQALKAKGVLLGNKKNLKEAQQKGADSNRARGEEVVRQICNLLRVTPGSNAMTAPQIVKLCNAKGLLSGLNKPWTVSGIRRPLAKARKLLAVQMSAAGAVDFNEEIKAGVHYHDNPNFGRF